MLHTLEPNIQNQKPDGLFVTAYDAEMRLHRMFKDKRMNGEWFNLNSEDILFITSKLDTILIESMDTEHYL